MDLWNRISELRIDLEFAKKSGSDEVEKLEWKLEQIMADSVSDELYEAIEWADTQEEYASPFDKEGFIDSYYTEAARISTTETARTTSDKKQRIGVLSRTPIFSVRSFLYLMRSSKRLFAAGHIRYLLTRGIRDSAR